MSLSHPHKTCKETALCKAIRSGLIDVVRLELEAGTDDDECNELSTHRPLYVACNHGSAEILDLLLSRISTPLTLASNLFRIAVRNSSVDVVDVLLKHTADVDNRNVVLGKAVLCALQRLNCLQHKTDKTSIDDKDLQLLRSLVDAGADVTVSTSHGQCPLHIACSLGLCEVIRLFLQHGANCNQMMHDGTTALRIACEKQNVAAVELLLSSGARVLIKEDHFNRYYKYHSRTQTPLLLLAAKNDDNAIVQMLLEHGANVGVRDRRESTALHVATTSAVMTTLLNAGADVNAVNKRLETPLYVLCSARTPDAHLVELLLESGANPNAYSQNLPLYVACKNNEIEIVQLLLARGAGVNIVSTDSRLGSQPFATPLSPLGIACKSGTSDMMTELLRKGASTEFADESGETALHFTVRSITHSCSEPSAIVNLLVQYGASVNTVTKQGETPLYLACERGLSGIVKQLIESEAEVCPSDQCFRKHPLLVACEKNFTEIVSVLLNSAADVNLAYGGKTPLTVAADNCQAGMVEVLLNHGANVNMMDGDGNTALYAAVKSMTYRKPANAELVSTIRTLLTYGAETNALDSNGVSGLFLACSCGKVTGVNLDVVQLLLEYGADPDWIPPAHQHSSYSDSDRSTPLLSYAARYNDVTLMKLLTKFGAELEQKDSMGRTALYYALRTNKQMRHAPNNSYNTAALNFLLSSGAEVNVTDSCGMSPLFLASESGALVFVKTLLSSGADPKLRTSENCPLLIACKQRHHKIVKLLLERGADVQAADKDGKSALYHAVESVLSCGPSADLSVVILLLNHGADANTLTTSGSCPLLLACKHRHHKMVELLLEHRADVQATDKDGKSALYLAVESILSCGTSADLSLVNLLLDHGADANTTTSSGSCPLLIACRKHKYHKIVKLLLEHGADVKATDKDGKSALYLAVESVPSCGPSADLSAVNLLLDHGADANTTALSGQTALYIACSKGLKATVRRLLKCGAKVNVSNDKKSPLNVACKNKRKAVARVLLREGADPNIPEETATNISFPLHIAAADNNYRLIRLLLNHGANVNVVDAFGNTALHHVIRNVIPVDRNRREVGVDTLLRADADVNVINSNGETPLYLAAEKGMLDVVVVMLIHGGNPNVHSSHKIPLRVAREKQNVRLVRMLLKTGADPYQ